MIPFGDGQSDDATAAHADRADRDASRTSAGTSNEGAGRTTSDDATIDVADCSVAFGELPVLEGVSLTVSSGEFVGLVGPNGAGKTTLVRTISGALEPDAGSVTIDGLDVHEASSRASSQRVAVVPQDTTLSFSFPVRDVVSMGRHPHRSRFSPPDDEDRAAVDAALERTRTTDLADRPIDEVSGGQRQRVVLARAVAQETPALLLDEPTANLDVNHQIETLELVRELVAEGKAVVAAIHDLSLAARYCDRLALLADGEIHSVGPPETVLSSAALADAFDANAAVTTNPVTDTPSVTALPEADLGETDVGADVRVHVVGAGRTASSVLTRLALAGFDVTYGPVPAGDDSLETVDRFALEAETVDPFSPLSAADRSRIEAWIDRADVTVLADPLIGDSAEFAALLETLETVPSLAVADRRSISERSVDDRELHRQYARCSEDRRETSPKRIVDAIAAELEAAVDRDESTQTGRSGVDDGIDSDVNQSVESPSD